MKKRIIFGVLSLAAFILILNSVFVVYPNEYKAVRQFGAVVRIVDHPGPQVKIPIFQKTLSIPNYEMCYDIPVSSITTADKKIMIVDSFALWKIEDPYKYIISLGANKNIAEERINTNIYNAMKNVLSNTKQDEIISGRDGELAQSITDKVGTQLEVYGIKLLKVETKTLDLPEENKAAVYARMISERNNIAAGYTAKGESQKQMIINETDKQVTLTVSNAEAEAEKLKAEGEAEYMKIMSSVYNDTDKAEFYNYVRSLEALKTSLKSKNGQNVLVLPADSEFARILTGGGETESAEGIASD